VCVCDVVDWLSHQHCVHDSPSFQFHINRKTHSHFVYMLCSQGVGSSSTQFDDQTTTMVASADIIVHDIDSMASVRNRNPHSCCRETKQKNKKSIAIRCEEEN
jgi:hypothetical protein